MTFLVGEQGLEQVLGDIVAKLFTELAARLVGGAGVLFAG